MYFLLFLFLFSFSVSGIIISTFLELYESKKPIHKIIYGLVIVLDTTAIFLSYVIAAIFTN